MHEIVHLSGNTLRRFGHVWNLVAGVPMLTPSFFYESHIAHHSVRHYGTEQDGEYLPFASGRWSGVLRYFSQIFWQPVDRHVTLRGAHAPFAAVSAAAPLDVGTRIVVRDQLQVSPAPAEGALP